MAHQQQPQAQPQMAVPKSENQKDVEKWQAILNDRLKNTDPVMNPQGQAEWSSGFFECCSPIDTCLLTYFCGCVTFGRTYHRLHKGSLDTWSPVNASCLGLMAASCFGVHCIPLMLQRTEIREKSNPKLKGDLVTDFLKAWCCGLCDLVQQDKESQRLLESASVVTQQPVKNEGMHYGA